MNLCPLLNNSEKLFVQPSQGWCSAGCFPLAPATYGVLSPSQLLEKTHAVLMVIYQMCSISPSNRSKKHRCFSLLQRDAFKLKFNRNFPRRVAGITETLSTLENDNFLCCEHFTGVLQWISFSMDRVALLCGHRAAFTHSCFCAGVS